VCVQPQSCTLRRDPPLAEPSRTAFQFSSLCFPTRELMHLEQYCSITSEMASCTIYSIASFQPSMTEGADLLGQHHSCTGCNPLCTQVLSSVFLFFNSPGFIPQL
jgi:hypothetical protein